MAHPTLKVETPPCGSLGHWLSICQIEHRAYYRMVERQNKASSATEYAAAREEYRQTLADERYEELREAFFALEKP